MDSVWIFLNLLIFDIFVITKCNMQRIKSRGQEIQILVWEAAARPGSAGGRRTGLDTVHTVHCTHCTVSRPPHCTLYTVHCPAAGWLGRSCRSVQTAAGRKDLQVLQVLQVLQGGRLGRVEGGKSRVNSEEWRVERVVMKPVLRG